MLAGPAPSKFLVLEGGPNDKQCPLIQSWTYAYLSWSLALFFPWVAFRIMNMYLSWGSYSISCPLRHMMVKVKWPRLSTYITLFSWFMRNMSFLTNRLAFCLHTHFTNLHFAGWSTYWLTPCTDLRDSIISLKTHSIVLIQTILAGNYYGNGGVHMNPLLIFGSASVTCSFNLWRARWNLLIFGTGSSISLRILPVPRGSLISSLSQHSSLMELHNLMRERALSQMSVYLPLI